MPIQRRSTIQVSVGHIIIGSDYPVTIQSMTNTPTADAQKTLEQIHELVEAGSELVRITINDAKAAEAAVDICSQLKKTDHDVPIIGDFHFNGHQLLSDYPALAVGLAKYRINPGNVGRGEKHDNNFKTIIDIAIANQKPIRIGVNSGSLDPELLTFLMDENAKSPSPQSSQRILNNALIESALQSAQYAIDLGLPEDKIIISAKTSNLQDLIYIYQILAKRCRFPLHVGLTEAGSAEQGIVSSSAAISILLEQGIGDTIRVSLTPDDQHPRWKEVKVSQHILQSLGLRFFYPKIISCPGCGRTSSNLFKKLLKSVRIHISQNFKQWQKDYPGVERLTIAVMGCVVNGPGESKHADIGISLPNQDEDPNTIPVFIKGKLVKTLRGEEVEVQFLKMMVEFIRQNF